jgi:hypothetical protein
MERAAAMTTRKGGGVSLAVIDERLRNMQEAQAERHGVVNRRIDGIERKLDSGVVSRGEFDDFKKTVVTQTEFGPVKRIAFGLVTVIVGSVVAAMLGLVLIKGPLP